MDRKVFISFLGTTDYYSSQYYRGKKFCSGEEKYVQIAALQYIQKNARWTETDIAYILLTKEAKNRNWLDNGYVDRNRQQNVGLESTIKAKGYSFPCEPVYIPEGKNEKEIWQIFKIIHDLIQDGDELYFDITHGFRYLPMLIVVLGNYAKFLEKVKVMRILYGNYEGRDKDENGNFINPARSPLVDLQSFSTLQDWTYAVADFINNGNADRLSNLSAPFAKRKQERANTVSILVDSINAFAKDMQTCRGQNIIRGDNVRKLKDDLHNVERILEEENEDVSVDQLLIPVFHRINEKVKCYNEDGDITNGFQAVGWCLEHNLHQQAITILQESVKNYFLQILNRDIKKDEERSRIGENLKLACSIKTDLLSVAIGEPIGSTKCSKSMKAIAGDYNKLRKLRNDVNHSGYKDNPLDPLDIEKAIEEIYCSITQKLGISVSYTFKQ